MLPLLPLQVDGLLFMSIVGTVFVLVAIVFIFKPELSLAPLSGDSNNLEGVAPIWGRFVAIVLLIVGGLLLFIAIRYVIIS